MAGKILLLISIMILMLSAGCNNPSGGSVVSANHTPLLKPPGPFSFSTVRAANGSVLVTWQASNRASEYKFYMGTSSSDISTLVTTCELSSRRCDLTGLSAGTTYYFRAEAINVAGTQQVKNIASALSVGSFDITSSSVADGAMTISWSSSTGATSYNIVYGTSPGSYSQERTNVTSPYVLTGLNNGVTYYAKVLAVNSNNGYLLSDSEASGAPFGAPVPPSDLTAVSSPSQIDLEWSSVPGATSYKIFKGTSSGSLTEITPSVTTTTYVDTNTITPGQTYYYAVKAYNGYDSPLSSEVSTKVIAAFNTTAVSVGPLSQQLTVTWPNVTGASSYDVYYGTNPFALSSSVTNATSPLTLSSLTGGSIYYVQVVAKNAVGAGTSQTASNLPSATPISSLTAPTSLTATAVPGTITLNWSAVAGASTYQILKGTSSGSLSALPTPVAGTSYTDTSITNGTTYFYAVKAYNGLYSASSSEASVKPISHFTISSATTASSTSLDVSWSTVPGADSYDVMYGTVSGTYTSTSAGTSTTRTLTGLLANTTYYIVVKAKNAIGSGTEHISTQVSAKTSTAAPSALAASAIPAQVTLTWTAPAGASSFKIYRGTASGSANYTEIESASTGSPFVDTDITNGVTYFYAVKANNGTDSAYSSEVSIRPIDSVTGLSLSIATSTSATVTWPVITGAASYDILYGTSSSNLNLSYLNATSPKTITGLSAGTTYHFAIRAKNVVGAGTNVLSASSSLLMSAGAPTGVAATAGAGRVDLSWNTVATATSYNIYRGTTSGSHTQIASNVTTLTYADTDVTLVNGTQYYYVIRAYNGAESTNSSEVTAKPIATPSFDSLVATNSSITFTWTTPAGASTFDILYRTTPTDAYTTLSNKTSGFSLTGLTANSTYYFVLKAKNAVGTGAFVNSTEVSQTTALGAPTGLTASTSNGIVTLNWTAVTGATHYKLYRSTTSASFSATPYQDNVATNSFTDSGAAAGTTYYYVVSAYNGVNSAQSSQVSMKPIATFSITNATVLSSTSIELTWPTVAGADSYDIRHGTNPASLSTLATQTSPKTFTGLTPNSTYYFIVVAKNSVGGSNTQLSNQASATTAFGAPSGLTASADHNQVNLSWNSVSGASSYKIYRGTTSGTRSFLASHGSNSYVDSTAVNGTTYYYTVRADNGTESADSSEIAVKPISNFSLTAATAASASTINLTWDTATGADSYDVRYGTNTGVYLFSVSGVTSSYTLSSLDSGTIYYISIRARNSVGAGTTKDSLERNAKTALGAPTTLALSATPGSVAISWGAVTGATNYNVYRSETASGGPYSQIATAVSGTSYTDSGRSNGTSYFYVVRSYNGLESVNSLEKSVSPIESFTVTSAVAQSSTTALVTWPTVVGAESYDIIYRPASGGASTTLLNQTSPASITGLTAATRYFFLVKAKNTIGVTTNFSSAEVEATTATGAPSSLTATTVTGSITLSWSPVTGATSYKVYKGTTSGVYTLLSTITSATSTTDSDIVNGTQYYYVVRAFNGTESVNSAEATGKPIANFTIATVTPLSSTSLQVAWNAAVGAASYDLYYRSSTGSYGAPVTGVNSGYTLSGLTANTTYYFKILAKNTIGSGTSVYSNEVYKITPLPAPSGLTANAEDSVINLSWTTNGASSYKIFRGEISGALTEITTGVSGGTYSDSTVSNGTTYYYAVKAYNGSDSALSSEVFKQPIAIPVDVVAESSSGTQARVNWTESAGAETYKIRYGTEPGNYTVEITNANPGVTITGLEPGGTYYGHIIASNTIGGGTTVYSEEFRFRTNVPPELSSLADQEIVSDTSLYLDFTLSDEDHVLDCSNTYLSASSSNTAVADSASFSFSGSLPNCRLRITPRASSVGTTTIGITANDGISTTSISFSLNVIGCVVSSMTWVTQPVTTNAGTTMTTQPKLQLNKVGGGLCTTNLNPVSISIGTDDSTQQDAVVLGTTSVTPSAGYATFSNINIQRAATAHTLIASQGTISSDESQGFSIQPLAASKIIFSQPPMSTIKSATLSPFPEVRVTDTYGNYASTNTTVSLALQVVTGSGTLAGTTSKTTTSGAASFSNLSINNVGTFNIRATNTSGYAAITSPNFSVINSTPRTVAGTYDMLQGPIIYPSGSSLRMDYQRSSFPVGAANSDGTKTFDWRFVATNPHPTTSSTIYLRYNNSTIATRSIPANTTTPTTYIMSNIVSTFSSNVNISIRVRYGAGIIHSSKFIMKQSSANKTQSYIPLTLLNSSAVETITTSNTSNLNSAASPNDINFPAYHFVKSRFNNVSTAYLTYSAKAASGGSACVSLWNKTTNSMISTESCTSSSTETYVTSLFDAALLPNDANIEIRFRSTSGTASLYKAGLLLNLVGIDDFTNVEIANQAATGLSANTTFATHRFMALPTNYGLITPAFYLKCRVKTTAAGSASLVLKDYGTSTTSQTASSTISASTINLSNQTLSTALTAGPLATTAGNYLMMNFAYGGSGTFSLGGCFFETEAAY